MTALVDGPTELAKAKVEAHLKSKGRRKVKHEVAFVDQPIQVGIEGDVEAEPEEKPDEIIVGDGQEGSASEPNVTVEEPRDDVESDVEIVTVPPSEPAVKQSVKPPLPVRKRNIKRTPEEQENVRKRRQEIRRKKEERKRVESTSGASGSLRSISSFGSVRTELILRPR